MDKCQRCGRVGGNVGPWSGEGEGGYTLLCLGCKFDVTLTIPGMAARLGRGREAAAAEANAAEERQGRADDVADDGNDA